jgi:hypothetical protein
VEYTQKDEKFIRRMLQREQKKANRIQLQSTHGSTTNAAASLIIADSLLSTPLKSTPQLKRSRSQVDGDDLDDEMMRSSRTLQLDYSGYWHPVHLSPFVSSRFDCE